MVIYFRTKRLKNICDSSKEAVKELGAGRARRLQQRLMELRAAECLGDILHTPPQRRHELTGNREGQISVDLQHPYRLIFIPANDPVPRKSDGGLDLSRIDEIEIIEIIDTH